MVLQIVRVAAACAATLRATVCAVRRETFAAYGRTATYIAYFSLAMLLQKTTSACLLFLWRCFARTAPREISGTH